MQNLLILGVACGILLVLTSANYSPSNSDVDGEIEEALEALQRGLDEQDNSSPCNCEDDDDDDDECKAMCIEDLKRDFEEETRARPQKRWGWARRAIRRIGNGFRNTVGSSRWWRKRVTYPGKK